MKRCPQCNRLETDDALGFCRVDGTALVNDSEAGTAKFRSGSAATEIETSLLPDATDADMSRVTGLTTVLPAQQRPRTTSELTKAKQRKALIAAVASVAVAIAIAAYFYLSRKNNAAIQSVAVMPFQNASGNSDVEYLSDGITESLINSLSQLPNLSVKARSTAIS